jgi:prophage DNA circulation protein
MKLLATLALGATILSAPSVGAASSDRAADHDITRPMAVQRADRLFTLLDTDHEGVLTRDEARAAGSRLMAQRLATGEDRAPGIGGHTLKYFEHALESASSVNRRQFEQVMLAHFDQMDTDHDGILTAAERQEGRHRVEKDH